MQGAGFSHMVSHCTFHTFWSQSSIVKHCNKVSFINLMQNTLPDARSRIPWLVNKLYFSDIFNTVFCRKNTCKGHDSSIWTKNVLPNAESRIPSVVNKFHISDIFNTVTTDQTLPKKMLFLRLAQKYTTRYKEQDSLT